MTWGQRVTAPKALVKTKSAFFEPSAKDSKDLRKKRLVS